jgi:hypothetical protein
MTEASDGLATGVFGHGQTAVATLIETMTDIACRTSRVIRAQRRPYMGAVD